MEHLRKELVEVKGKVSNSLSPEMSGGTVDKHDRRGRGEGAISYEPLCFYQTPTF